MDRTDPIERVERLRVIAIEIDSIVREIGPKMIRLAHLREESRVIIGGLDARSGQ